MGSEQSRPPTGPESWTINGSLSQKLKHRSFDIKEFTNNLKYRQPANIDLCKKPLGESGAILLQTAFR